MSLLYMSNRELVETQIKQVVSEQLGVEISTIQEDSQFTQDLGADSLDLVELIMALEEKFEMSIPDESVEKIKTVNDVVDYIVQNLKV